MGVIAGAPNLVRGGSHSGNVAASALLRAGLVDALASDYVPASLVHAAFIAADRRARPAGARCDLVSRRARPHGRPVGSRRIAPGLRADLVRVRVHEGLPVVRQVWVRAASGLIQCRRRAWRCIGRPTGRRACAAGNAWLGATRSWPPAVAQPRPAGLAADHRRAAPSTASTPPCARRCGWPPAGRSSSRPPSRWPGSLPAFDLPRAAGDRHGRLPGPARNGALPASACPGRCLRGRPDRHRLRADAAELASRRARRPVAGGRTRCCCAGATRM